MSARMMGHLARMQTLPVTLFSEHYLFKVKHKVNLGQYKMQTADDQSKFLGHGFNASLLKRRVIQPIISILGSHMQSSTAYFF